MGSKSPDQEKIIALEAQVKELKDLKFSAQVVNKQKHDQNGRTNKINKLRQEVETIKVKPKEEADKGAGMIDQTNHSKEKTRNEKWFFQRRTTQAKMSGN